MSRTPSILAIDQGTTGTTCLVLSEDGRVLGRAYSEFTQYFPQPGWVEHDALEIWDVTQAVAREALASAEGADVRGIGITNQRETVVLWDRDTLEPVHRAIVWQDRRTAGLCADLKEAGHEPEVRQRTGLVLDPYFSGTKLLWLLRERPDLRSPGRSGRVGGRNDRHLADRSAHIRDGPRDRSYECFPYAVVQPVPRRVGPVASRHAGNPAGPSPGGEGEQRRLRNDSR